MGVHSPVFQGKTRIVHFLYSTVFKVSLQVLKYCNNKKRRSHKNTNLLTKSICVSLKNQEDENTSRKGSDINSPPTPAPPSVAWTPQSSCWYLLCFQGLSGRGTPPGTRQRSQCRHHVFHFSLNEGFQLVGSTASCKPVLGGFRDLAGVFGIEGREEVVDGSGQWEAQVSLRRWESRASAWSGRSLQETLVTSSFFPLFAQTWR